VKLIVIAGGTASGKTTAALIAARRLPEALLIHHDRYYRDIPHPRGFNFDHPDALDTDGLVADLERLKAGQPVDLPVYDFSRHARAAHTERVAPCPLVMVEGILTLAHPGLAAMADLRVYVHTPDDIRLARRLRRDILERGRTVESVLDQYLQTVRPMHLAWVAPCEAGADLVLDGTAPPELVGEALAEAITRRA